MDPLSLWSTWLTAKATQIPRETVSKKKSRKQKQTSKTQNIKINPTESLRNTFFFLINEERGPPENARALLCAQKTEVLGKKKTISK